MDITQVPKIDYEELKREYCLKVIGWGKHASSQRQEFWNLYV